MLRSIVTPLRRHFDQLLVRERTSAHDPGTDCLDMEALALAADGSAPPDAIDHLSRCPSCRAQLAELLRLLSAPSVALELARLNPDRRLRVHPWRARLLMAGAAAVLALALVRIVAPGPSSEPDQLRDAPGVIRGAVPTLVAPEGQVTGDAVFSWTTVPEASQYRMTVFDAEGGLIWSGDTSDSTLALPADVTLAPGIGYWWRVEARVDFDRWVASDLADFHLR